MTAARAPAPPTAAVLRALKLGDLLAAVPALRALRRALPEHRIVLAAPRGLAPLARHTGAVDAVAHTPGLGPLPAVLHGAAVAVNLHGRGPESTARLAATRPRRLLAFDVPGGPRWREGEHERARWCRLLTAYGIPADPADYALGAPGPAPPSATGATVVHPGASSGARRWPESRWAAIAARERAAGRPVLVTGSASERPLAARVARAAGLPAAAVLAGRTSLLDLLAVVAAAGRVVTGDTGVAHVATATGTPSVVLFGPTPPQQWGPPRDGPHVALWKGVRSDPHARAPAPGLLAIRVDEVAAALDRLPPPGRAGYRPARAGT